jgi:hypothetical protein
MTSNPPFSPDVEVVQTADRVFYRFRYGKDYKPSVFLLWPVAAAVLVAVAGWIVVFLVEHFQDISWPVLVLSTLFVAQLLFVARLPWKFFRHQLWQKLAVAFGHGELELCGDKLFLGSRVGPLWAGEWRSVQDFQRVVVYVYLDQGSLPAATESPATANGTPKPHSRCLLAVETEAKEPWFLVDGFSQADTLALAEDLHRRLVLTGQDVLRTMPLLPVTVIETDLNALYPPLGPDYYRRQKPWWLGWHLSGAAGLGALTAATIQTGDWQSIETRLLVSVGWVMEMALLGFTIYLPGHRATGGSKADSRGPAVS